MSDIRPRLRRIEAFPLDHEGRRFLGLRDPSGYTESVIMVPMELCEIVSLFDGEHSIVDIQAALMRAQGELVRSEEIEGLIDGLEAQGFMDSPAFEARRAAIDGAFLATRTRPAAHAGGAYAADPAELRAAMDGFFTAPAGPGPVGATRRGVAVRGLVAPHIDFHRGGPAYAWAYRDLAERGDAEVFVIFGTCHAGMAEPFALTRKAYDTPFGSAPVETDFVDALSARARLDLFASELAHRGEHSIEFQAVFLQYLFAGRRDIRIVPVLTSFAHEAMVRGVTPAASDAVRRFHDALAETAAASGRRVAFIAGADLAHVGPRFGDAEPVSTERLGRVEREDRAMLSAVERGDADAFFESVARDGDSRRICGLSPIYSLLCMIGSTTPGGQGVLRRYAQWPDPQGTVTFASLVF
jgi:AmmeMemoRadiSam system protein B